VKVFEPHKAAEGAKHKFNEGMLADFEALIQAGNKRITVVDYYMGGKTADSLREQVFKPLLAKYPDVKFDVRWIRETVGLENSVSAGGREGIRGTLKPTQQHADRLNISAENVRMALGDDMSVILNPNTSSPLRIFDKDGNVIRVIEPENGETARELLIRLLNEGS
jgi:hypothetical protein